MRFCKKIWSNGVELVSFPYFCPKSKHDIMIKIHNLGLADSVFNQFMAELRDSTIQQDRMRFRRNLERIGEIMAYEISKTFEYEAEDVYTPLGIKTIRTLREQPVIATILRAGLPFHNGMLNMLDHADSAFIAALANTTRTRKIPKSELSIIPRPIWRAAFSSFATRFWPPANPS